MPLIIVRLQSTNKCSPEFRVPKRVRGQPRVGAAGGIQRCLLRDTEFLLMMTPAFENSATIGWMKTKPNFYSLRLAYQSSLSASASLSFITAIAVVLVLVGCRSELITEEDKVQNIVAEAEANSASETEMVRPVVPRMSGDAFRIAAHDGNVELVREGIESGIDVTATDAQGHTALHMAAYNGHTDIAGMLLAAGCDVDRQDAEGKTALMHASSGDFADTVQLLLDANAGIDIVDTGERYTALMTAAALGEKAVVEVLLKHGANKDLVDADGDTAKDFALRAGHTEIVALLDEE